MHFAMKTGQSCFLLWKFLAISLAIQKIATDCGCDAVVHLGFHQSDTQTCTSNVRQNQGVSPRKRRSFGRVENV